MRWAGLNVPRNLAVFPDTTYYDHDGSYKDAIYDKFGDGLWVGSQFEECGVAAGDSGGPAFVLSNPPRVVSIHSSRSDGEIPGYPGHPFGYNSVAIDWKVSYFASEITLYLALNP